MSTIRYASVCEINVPGIPKPGGSKRAFYNKKLGRSMIVDACKKSAAWKDTVAAFARQAYQGDPLRTPLMVRVVFTMPRPKSHYWPVNAKHYGELRADAPDVHTSKPDLTKLWRSTEDALTGIVWADDSLIFSQEIAKEYGEKPGALIAVQQLSSPAALPGEKDSSQ